MKRRGLVIAISDFYEDEAAITQMRRLRRMGHDVIAIHVLSQEELSLDVGGAAEFVDLETRPEAPGAAVERARVVRTRVRRLAGERRARASSRRHRLPAGDHGRAARAGVAPVSDRPAGRRFAQPCRSPWIDSRCRTWIIGARGLIVAADCDPPAGAAADAVAAVSVAAVSARNRARRVSAASDPGRRVAGVSRRGHCGGGRPRSPGRSCTPHLARRDMRIAFREPSIRGRLKRDRSRGSEDVFRSATFNRTAIADAIGDGLRWLDAQPPSAREIVFAGSFRRGSIDEQRPRRGSGRGWHSIRCGHSLGRSQSVHRVVVDPPQWDAGASRSTRAASTPMPRA